MDRKLKLAAALLALSAIDVGGATAGTLTRPEDILTVPQPGTGNLMVNGPLLIQALQGLGYNPALCTPNCQAVLQLPGDGGTYSAGRISADGTASPTRPAFAAQRLVGAVLLVNNGATTYQIPGGAGAGGADRFLDCSAGAAGNGSSQFPWNSLAAVNAQTFLPGDRLLIKRGTACTGTLSPKGSGSTASPIRIDAYGTGAKPMVAGNGAGSAVYLRNQQGWEIRNLELTNRGPAKGNRRAVTLELEDFGIGTHYVLENLDIHDVNGDDTKDGNGSGGIYVQVLGSRVQTRFDDVLIKANTIRTVDREGIFLYSSWKRESAAFVPSTNVVITGNRLSDIGGDGIVAAWTSGARVSSNTLAGFQLRSAGYNAGIWTYQSDNVLFEFNDVSGGGNTLDGMAYDIDEGAYGTIYQYNYSHDNVGGWMLLCNASGDIHDGIIRYNISQNDSFRGIENCSGGITSVDVYNNTIYIGPNVSQTVINENNTNRRNVRFRNNLVMKSGAGLARFALRSGGYVLDHNNLYGTTGAPAGSGTGADPRLSAPGTATGQANADGYRLCTGSPALGTGILVTNNGGRDYFGNPVSATATPNIGAYAGPALACP